MEIRVVQGRPLDGAADLVVIGMFRDARRPLEDADRTFDGELSKLISREGFEGKLGQTLVFPTFGKLPAKKFAVIGLGEKKSFTPDAARKLGGFLVKLAMSNRATTLATSLPGAGVNGMDSRTAAQALAEGFFLSAYRFHVYHGTLRKKETPPRELKTVSIYVTANAAKSAEEGIRTAEILSTATNYARDLVNTPSSEMTPARMAEEARAMVGNGIRVKVMDANEMERRGMCAALAVARGSVHAPVGVHLSYRPAGAKRTVAIVGKAVTFDSGGLSIKPAKGMETMKIDMAGAAAVLGLFKALAELRLPVAVHGVFLAVENMPSGTAYRPGDIIRAMNGTTIEILNTDAEGRVTLADALSYAASLKPDMIVDLATLTGACVVALGEEVAGLMSTDPKLSRRLRDAADESGEPLWELPLFPSYFDHIRSKIADIKNTGNGSAGTITAALFLKQFVGDTPWAHLDIAGPSYTERETRPDQPYGGTGYGVRLLVRFLQQLRR
ncbi:leucyl aminopeptidase [Candidatus Uhrbacteria bacterium]|nr:leucyl aminopeptidase [Candidatus Uhrbacteria bacterium]